MIPLPLYTAAYQPNLLASFTDFKREIAGFVGYGTDSSLWTGDQSAELARDVQEAYRWILYPQTIPGERIPLTWSFMEKTATVTTTSGTYNYALAADFGSFVGHYMYWPADSGYDPPCRTNESAILNQRQYDSDSNRPRMFAIRWSEQVAGSNQRREVIFWPTPDDEYTLTYKHAVLPGPLSETNPYPLGGPRISQLMMEACRAIGESKKNGARGDRWGIFIEQLMATIQLDKGTNTTPTLGVLSGGYGGDWLPQTQRTHSYYRGPAADGTYTLAT